MCVEKKKSLGLTNLLLGARAGQMVPPTHHHPDFSHDQKEQEVSAGGEAKWVEGKGRSRRRETDEEMGRKGCKGRKGEGRKVVNVKG